MKTVLFLLTFCVTLSNYAQNGINYKAVVKDHLGNVVANQSVTLQFSILKGNGLTNEYTEIHNPTTDANGIAIVNIGEGVLVSGNYAVIDWGSADHFFNVQVNTGAGLIDLGTIKFMAVPYAKHAETVNEISGIQSSKGTLYLSESVRNTWVDYSHVDPIIVTESGTYMLNFYGWGQNTNGFNSAVTGNDFDGNMQVRVLNNTTAQEILLMNATLMYIDATVSSTVRRYVTQEPSTWRILQLNAGDELKIQYNQWSFFETHTSTWQMGPSGISIVKITNQ